MIWFDLDNSPHVQIFQPIFNELNSVGEGYFITARDFAQTVDLLEYYNLPYTKIGKHGGKTKIKKIENLLQRSLQLYKFIKDINYDLAISHGSRTQLVTNRLKNRKSIVMFDYEYTESKIFNYFSSYLLTPKFIPDDRLKQAGFNLRKIIKYNGFKEEIYLSTFKPKNNFKSILEVGKEKKLVVIRPPAMLSNYHNSRSENILIEMIKYFLRHDDIHLIVVPRTKVDEEYIKTQIHDNDKISFLKKVVDGLQLIYASDIFISGGGTMNREAALLGIPTFSIFTGKRPYLDEYLAQLGRLKFIETLGDINKIKIDQLERKEMLSTSKNLSKELVNLFLELKHEKISL